MRISELVFRILFGWLHLWLELAVSNWVVMVGVELVRMEVKFLVSISVVVYFDIFFITK